MAVASLSLAGVLNRPLTVVEADDMMRYLDGKSAPYWTPSDAALNAYPVGSLVDSPVTGTRFRLNVAGDPTVNPDNDTFQVDWSPLSGGSSLLEVRQSDPTGTEPSSGKTGAFFNGILYTVIPPATTYTPFTTGRNGLVYSKTSTGLTYTETPSLADFVAFRTATAEAKGEDLFEITTLQGKSWVSKLHGVTGSFYMTPPTVDSIEYSDRATADTALFRPGYVIKTTNDGKFWENNTAGNAWINIENVGTNTDGVTASDLADAVTDLNNAIASESADRATAINSEIAARTQAINDAVAAQNAARDAALAGLDTRAVWIFADAAERNIQNAIASEGTRAWLLDGSKAIRTGSSWISTTDSFQDPIQSFYAYFGSLSAEDVDTFLDGQGVFGVYTTQGFII